LLGMFILHYTWCICCI